MPPGFRITCGADPREVARVAEAFDRFATANGVSAGVRRSVQVALDDLLSNAIGYGFAGREGGAITVEAELLPGRLALVISDDGQPFDPFAVAAPDTTLTAEQRLPGGLGIHLVRQLMDEVAYERRGSRNVITLAKRLAEGR